MAGQGMGTALVDMVNESRLGLRGMFFCYTLPMHHQYDQDQGAKKREGHPIPQQQRDHAIEP